MIVKPKEKLLFAIVFALAVLSLIAGLWTMSSKWITTAGLLLDIAGLVQLDVSGALDAIYEKYADIDKYPHGPPSHITHDIIDDPDRPMLGTLRWYGYSDVRTGFYIIIAGCFVQLVGTWFPAVLQG